MRLEAKRSVAKTAPRYSREKAEVRRAMLIEAATRCLIHGGIGAFTIDSICAEAKVSRGLVNHYFDSRDGLLAEVYRTSFHAGLNAQIEEAKLRRAEHSGFPAEASLCALLKSSFLPDHFNRENLQLWLWLWGETAVNAQLRAAHRDLYHAYRAELTAGIAAVAEKRGKQIDNTALARNFIALVDGLWLECCLDNSILTPEVAEASCFEMVESQLGPLRNI